MPSPDADHAAHGTDLQFYPTPDWLADKAWGLFKNRHVERVLDACAGTGALADAWARENEALRSYARQSHLPVDAVELDARHHPTLREKGYGVVGLDFLLFQGGAIYSHVIMNPPFANGVTHVLKGWDMLWSGELVAIVNAETLRNPHSAERRRLASLVREHGSVEFIADAFKGQGVDREADVEIALIHLDKPAECSTDWIGPVIEGLTEDRPEPSDFRLPTELALPRSFVENQCMAFRLAVKAMREAVRAEAVALHFAARIGVTMGEAQGRGVEGLKSAKDAERASAAGVRKALRDRYLELKDRAWTSVLRSTETLSKLSRKVQKQAESQFADIKALEFTESNVYGFLIGLVQSQPEMQIDMMCDVFDQVSRYHTDNAVYYRGWKSNDRHRRCGRRIRTTRFILPGHAVQPYQSSLPWESIQVLADIDKVFAMLDGRQTPATSLAQVFQEQFRELKAGQRVETSYFDVRFYPGIGTIHFFARDKKLVDRLNRLVGRRRAWVPPPDAGAAAETFWKAFDLAERFDAETRSAINEVHKDRRGGRPGYYGWDNPLRDATSGDTDERSVAAAESMAIAIDRVLERHGLLELLQTEERRTEIADASRSVVADEPLLLTTA